MEGRLLSCSVGGPLCVKCKLSILLKLRCNNEVRRDARHSEEIAL